MFIVGASTLGEIAYSVIQRLGGGVSGFYDDFITEGTFFDAPILGKIENLAANDKCMTEGVFVAIGGNKNRCSVCEKIQKMGLPLVNIIDPAAVVDNSVNLGGNTLILAGAYIGIGSVLGTGNIIFPGVSITHHNSVGDFNFFSPNASIGGYTTIGDKCKIAMGCVIAPYLTVKSETTLSPLTYFSGTEGML